MHLGRVLQQAWHDNFRKLSHRMSPINKQIAIIGAGPSGLWIYKRMVETGNRNLQITIFERKKVLGAGMPYSEEGAGEEHITNVSGNEIPHLVTPVDEWIQSVPDKTLKQFSIDPQQFNDYKVLPRLLFGQYLSDQFQLLLEKAEAIGIRTHVIKGFTIDDITDRPDMQQVQLTINGREHMSFDAVVICTGHSWPKKFEGTVPGYYDSPYPPAKLRHRFNHPVAIRGSSLTAIDAIRTLARHNGHFTASDDGNLLYSLRKESMGFKMVMHSRSGLLPAIRFHLDDSRLFNDSLLTREEIQRHISQNGGFLSLDYLFDKDFKEVFRERDPEFFQQIRTMSIEQFVETMMELRERLDPFQLFKAEYAEAEKSIRRRQSVYWKEMLAVLSFAVNYPAKYLSAEDMLRLQKVLMPLIAIVIAFVPQSSAKEILSLHFAGVLQIVAVGDDSRVEPQDKGGILYHFTDEQGSQRMVFYQTFIDCTGQKHLAFDEFPFEGLIEGKTVSPALLRFRSTENALSYEEDQITSFDGNYYLKVPGIAINDNFQVVDRYGALNPRIYMMAVSYIGGYNPDYSGLDFCAAAATRIVRAMQESLFSGVHQNT